MDISNAIITKIKTNRISTTEVADCLGKTGNLPGVLPINRRHFAVGRVFWCCCYDQSNWPMHEALDEVRPGDVVLVDAINCEDRATLGALVSKFLLLYRQASAVVVNGLVRDVPHLIRENWPVWAKGVTPIGCFNKQPAHPLTEEIRAPYRSLYEGAIAVADDCGVVIIPRSVQNKAFLSVLDAIEEQEDEWFDRIDRQKWNTFETVCLNRKQDPKE